MLSVVAFSCCVMAALTAPLPGPRCGIRKRESTLSNRPALLERPRPGQLPHLGSQSCRSHPRSSRRSPLRPARSQLPALARCIVQQSGKSRSRSPAAVSGRYSLSRPASAAEFHIVLEG
jgi:hypothetical protein